MIAENLIAIEWELAQQRRMRDASLRDLVRKSICSAVVAHKEDRHEAELDEAFERFIQEGGDEGDWQNKPFERAPAEAAGEDLAARAMSFDAEVQAAAYEEVSALGMDPVDIMGEAYRSLDRLAVSHNARVRDLEGRRREVKRDLDGLQRTRPIEATVIDQ